MNTYVYGFVPSTHPLPIENLSGVGAPPAPLRPIRHGDLVAVVSDAPATLRTKRRDLEAHQLVLDTLCAAGTVLPMRFGMVATTDESVRRELAGNATRYADLLARLAGRVELNVKAVHQEEAVLRDLLAGDRGLREQSMALRNAGGGTHGEQVAFGERVAAAVAERESTDAHRTVAWLRRHATDVALGPRVDGCFVNASFLVSDDGRDGFDAALSRLREELSGYADVRVFGPLPPYSFVG